MGVLSNGSRGPQDFVNLFRKLTMNCASWSAYGYPGRDEDLEVVVKIAQEEVYHMAPGSHLVECVLCVSCFWRMID